jgi:imidazolonepropionase-like amidohydrolase
VPTLAVIAFIIEHAGDAAGHAVARASELHEAHRRNVGMAHRLGVPLIAGTDMGAPHTGPDSIHAELEHLVQVGLTPMEAIRAATQTPARAMRREADLGTVEVGRRADLLVLDRDPLDDIRATRALRHLLQDGRWVMRDGAPCRPGASAG